MSAAAPAPSLDEDDIPAIEVELPAVYAADQFADVAADAAISSENDHDVPDVVIKFLNHFHTQLYDRNSWDLLTVYESSFNSLTEKFFAKKSWPDPDLVARLVSDDLAFIILYKEMYYRHIYTALQPSIEERILSYTNYCDLFNLILNPADGPLDLELPSKWLWDIIDEFIYQFQSFSQYRDKFKSKSPAEIMTIKDRPDVWNVHNVLNVLYSLVQKSHINEQLIAHRTGGDVNAAAGEYHSKPLYRMLGYFSLVGLLHVQCLLGDYTLALSTMENFEAGNKGLFPRLTACHVTTYYYMGFAYMMTRRYSDAVKSFSNALNFISRTRHYHSRAYQYELLNRRSDQMYSLLAMCLVLSPQRIDENINSTLKEKYGDQYFKMQKGGDDALATFEEMFTYACPKFISPTPPEMNNEDGSALMMPSDPAKHQCRIFLSEIKTQVLAPTLRSYLKLYTNLPIEKLAAFLSLSPEDVRKQLLIFKHKSRQRQWVSGPVSSGAMNPISDLQFYLKQDQIYIAESRAGHRVADWFIRNIGKLDDVANVDKKATRI